MPCVVVDPADLEHRCADAWPALLDEPLGGWRMRAAGGFTGRANSTLVTGSPGLPLDEALLTAVAFAAAHDLTPKLHVVMGDPVEAALTGWRPDHGHSGPDGVLVLTGPLPPGDGKGVMLPEPSPGWWRLAVGSETPTPAQRHVLASGAASFAAVEVAGQVVAAVRGWLLGDLLHISRLAVDPAHRGTGLGRAVLATLAAWAAAHGATGCVLQVLATNDPAVGLYTSLGCTENHRYQYWVQR